MADLLRSSGKFRIASLFKLLMVIAMLMAFMPAVLRLGGSRLSFSYLYIIFCFAVLTVILLRDGRLANFYIRLARQNKLLFFSILAMFLAHIVRYAIDPAAGLMSRTLMALIVFCTAYLYFAFLFYRDAGNLLFFYRIISIGLIANFVIVVLAANGVKSMPGYYDSFDRFSGLFSHPNQLAIVVSTVFVFYVGSYFNDAKIANRFMWLAMLLIAVVASVLAGSKTNVFVFGIVLIAYLLWSVSRKNALIVLLSIGLFTLLLTYAGFAEFLLRLNPRLFSVVAELSPDNVMQYRTMESRLGMWAYSWDAGTAYPFMGEGWGSLILDDMQHSHNLFLDYFRVLGPVGLLLIALFVASITALFSRTDHNPQRRYLLKATKLSILGYLLANMLSDSMGPQTVFFLAFFVAYLSVIPGKIYTFNPGGASAGRPQVTHV